MNISRIKATLASSLSVIAVAAIWACTNGPEVCSGTMYGPYSYWCETDAQGRCCQFTDYQVQCTSDHSMQHTWNFYLTPQGYSCPGSSAQFCLAPPSGGG